MIKSEDLATFEAEETVPNNQGVEDLEIPEDTDSIPQDDLEIPEDTDSIPQDDLELDIDPEDKSIVMGMRPKKQLNDKLSHYSLSQLDLQTTRGINDTLCPIVCYYCNRFISPYYVQSLHDVPFIENDLKPFFEAYNLKRYCCRMIILQSRLMLNKQRLE